MCVCVCVCVCVSVGGGGGGGAVNTLGYYSADSQTETIGRRLSNDHVF